jgi:DNA-binding NarL/FixJ family response regulator
MFRILLVSHDPVVYDRIVHVLRENDFRDFTVVTATCGADALDKLRSKFDFLLLDLEVGHTKLLSFVLHLRQTFPSMPLVTFSFDMEYAIVRRFLTSGVSAYCLLEHNNYQELILAIDKNLAGKVYISPVMIEFVASQALYSPKNDRLHTLNTQEFDILLHLRKDNPYSVVAEILDVHVSIIAFHKSRILDKLRINNIQELENMIRVESVL